jgi:hypothetical protein
MLAHLEVKEINSRTFKDFPILEIFFPILGLSRIFKALGHPTFSHHSFLIGVLSKCCSYPNACFANACLWDSIF